MTGCAERAPSKKKINEWPATGGETGDDQMIQVTRLNGKGFWINPHLIEFLEETPDTVVTLLTGKKVVVKEPAQKILEEIITYRRKLVEGGNEVVPIEIRGE